MAFAATYAISSLSQGKLYSTIYDPIAVYTCSDTLPPDLNLHNWSWCDVDTDVLLFLPLETRILDHQRLTAQPHQDEDRSTMLHPPRRKNVTLRFATKVPNIGGSLSRGLGALRTSSL